VGSKKDLEGNRLTIHSTAFPYLYKVSLFITKNASQLNQNDKMKRYTYNHKQDTWPGPWIYAETMAKLKKMHLLGIQFSHPPHVCNTGE